MEMNYLDRLGREIRSRVPSSDLPDDETSGLFRIYAVLLLAKGTGVTARDVHNAWVAWMTDRDPSHGSLQPFEDLASDIASDDEPYVEAIRSVAEAKND